MSRAEEVERSARALLDMFDSEGRLMTSSVSAGRLRALNAMRSALSLPAPTVDAGEDDVRWLLRQMAKQPLSVLRDIAKTFPSVERDDAPTVEAGEGEVVGYGVFFDGVTVPAFYTYSLKVAEAWCAGMATEGAYVAPLLAHLKAHDAGKGDKGGKA